MLHLPGSVARSRFAGVKESDTGLAPPSQWDLAGDKRRITEEQPLQVARCTKIINAAAKEAPKEGATPGGKEEKEDQTKYVINVKQIAKFVVALGDRASPTDIEEGMRVGYDSTCSCAWARGADATTALTATNIRSKFLSLPRSTPPSP